MTLTTSCLYLSRVCFLGLCAGPRSGCSKWQYLPAKLCLCCERPPASLSPAPPSDGKKDAWIAGTAEVVIRIGHFFLGGAIGIGHLGQYCLQMSVPAGRRRGATIWFRHCLFIRHKPEQSIGSMARPALEPCKTHVAHVLLAWCNFKAPATLILGRKSQKKLPNTTRYLKRT